MTSNPPIGQHTNPAVAVMHLEIFLPLGGERKRL
jgi:hypothetical protein